VNITPEKQQEVEALVLKMIDKRQQIVACMWIGLVVIPMMLQLNVQEYLQISARLFALVGWWIAGLMALTQYSRIGFINEKIDMILHPQNYEQ
jgi:hypothetical protein